MTVEQLMYELSVCDPGTDVVLWDACSEEGFTAIVVDTDEFDCGEVGIVFNR